MLNGNPLPITFAYPDMSVRDYVQCRQRLERRSHYIAEGHEDLDDGWDPTVYDRNFQMSIVSFDFLDEVMDLICDLWENLDGIFCFYIRRDNGLNRLQFRFCSDYMDIPSLTSVLNTYWNENRKNPSELLYFFDSDLEIPFHN